MPTVRSDSGGDLPDLLGRWRADLAAWAIPEQITAAVTESPWVLPRQVFARRADRVSAAPSGPSFERAWAALDPPGIVLDVGSGAGAACLPLLPRTTSLTAVDADADMLDQLSQRAAAGGVAARMVLGRWPDTAAQAGPADVVTCHHVLYNVAEVAPFVTALTGSARRVVVAEMTGDADPSGTPVATVSLARVAAAAGLMPAAAPRPASRPVTATAAAIPVRLLSTRFPPMLSLLGRHAPGRAPGGLRRLPQLPGA